MLKASEAQLISNANQYLEIEAVESMISRAARSGRVDILLEPHLLSPEVKAELFENGYHLGPSESGYFTIIKWGV